MRRTHLALALCGLAAVFTFSSAFKAHDFKVRTALAVGWAEQADTVQKAAAIQLCVLV
jgi:hypothetical protein